MSSMPVLQEEVFEMEVESGFLPKKDDLLALGASLGVHVVALIALGMIHYEVLKSTDQTINSATLKPVAPTITYYIQTHRSPGETGPQSSRCSGNDKPPEGRRNFLLKTCASRFRDAP